LPMKLEHYRKLSDVPQRKGSTRKFTPWDYGQKCPILPNWRTDKEGHCKRTGCMFRGDPRCPAKG